MQIILDVMCRWVSVSRPSEGT